MSRWHAFSQLVLTRFREFYREPEAVFWVYGFPLILATVLSIAFARSEPPSPIVDVLGPSPQADKLADMLRQAKMDVKVLSLDECERRLKIGVSNLFVIPGEKLKYRYDPTRQDALFARHWIEEIWLRAQSGQSAPPATETDTFITDPGSRYIDFLIPGLLGMNLLGGGLFGIGFVLVDMRVRKLFKRFVATPMRRPDFILAIFTARMAFLIPEMLALFLLGRLVFGVPMYGSPIALILVMVIGAMAFNSLGLLLGSRTEKMETASGLINLVALPMWLLSGVFFTSKRFPDAAQPFIQALPLTQVNDALREIMLEGRGLADVAWRMGILVLWFAIPGLLALRWFRWR